MHLIQRIKNIFSPPSPLPPEDSAREEAQFKIRYQTFRRLLSANNAALDIMTELEEAAREHRHFGMHFRIIKVININIFYFIKSII